MDSRRSIRSATPSLMATLASTKAATPTTHYRMELTIGGASLPIPTSLPTNGFGGSWYNSHFQVPVYDHDQALHVVTAINWFMIDNFAQSTASVASVSGICLGLCLATLIYVVALTPTAKRGRPFHLLLLLALVAEIVRLLLDVIRISNLNVSPYSAYLHLTLDMSSTYWSTEYINLSIAKQSAAIFAYLFTVGCLFTQASGLLTNVRLNHAPVYWLNVGILLAGSAVTLGFRVTYTVKQVWTLQLKNTNLPDILLSEGLPIAYGASLGGWCLISLVSVLYLLYVRLRLAFAGWRLYQVALAVLAMIMLESFVVPLIFCILTIIFVPADVRIPNIDDLIIPTILILLPLGTLFMSVHSTQIKHCGEVEQKPKLNGPDLSTCNLMDGSRKTTTSTDPNDMPELPEAFQETYKTHHHSQKHDDPVDRELQEIDKIETVRPSSESGEFVSGCPTDGDILKHRARRVIRNLAARSVTPNSSQLNVV